MKNLQKVFTVLMFTLVLVSCGNDDDVTETVVTSENIVGVHQMATFTILDTETVTQGQTTVTNTYNTEADSNNVLWDFNADGSFTTAGTITFNYVENVNGEVISETYTESFINQGTYLVGPNGTILSLTFTNDSDFDTTVFDVISYSPNEIKLFNEESFSTQGFSDNTTIDITLTR